ncbi:hypothetical protein LOTGIDRAFT_154198 [Lottia gigantea]|uniref:Uncharacterized protein n=1 Tax=Lottia gigantea TaxID=225164 RepID=V4A2E8_LOTGI|nr:hypothetical protein LOTGIDRAFT_154198 [Lottia gigantea]ESO89115.1 hypothetical protein LOTGIDRAFT_154198 [Lottia gigantea]
MQQRALGVPTSLSLSRKRHSSEEKLYFRREVSKIHTTVQKSDKSRIFSASQERFNNANIARCFNTISTTVNNQIGLSQWETTEKLCGRGNVENYSGEAQCEILGTKYCSDCCRINEKKITRHEKSPKLYILPEDFRKGPLQTYSPMEVFQRVYKYHKNQLIGENTDIQTTDLPNRRPQSYYSTTAE